jgi:broad specificity phosphatase PhoE
MRELIFIRHGETDLAGTFCGHSDPPINDRGQIQVEELISRLSSEPLDAIHSSDLRRAVDTAAFLTQAFGVPCTTTQNLREIDFGDWEGLTWAEIEGRDQDYARRWIESYPNLPAPKGETFAAFECRILREVANLFRFSADKRLAVVTHGGVMQLVLRTFLGYTEKQARNLTTPYCSFFVYAGAASSKEPNQ